MHLLRSVRDAEGQITDFEVVMANAAADALAGQAITGRRMLVDWPFAREIGLFDAVVNTTETGAALDLEHFFRAPGIEGWYRWTAVQLGDGVVMAIENITARKQTEHAVQQTKDLLQAMFNATLDSFEVLQCVRDEAGHIVDFEWVLTNDAAHRLLERRDLVGLRLLQEEPTMRSSGVYARFCEVVQQQPRDFELSYPEPRTETWYHVAAAPFGDGLVVSWHDITARRNATAELMRLQAGAAAAAGQRRAPCPGGGAPPHCRKPPKWPGPAAVRRPGCSSARPALTDPTALASSHGKALQLLQTAIAQTRTISHELIPTILEDFGLVAAVREICQATSTPQCRLTCVADALPQLPPALALALYRMAQELATNIVKHAQSSTGTLSLFQRQGWLVLQAYDKGQGFDSSQPRNAGSGLKIIQNRVQLLNGQFRLRSSAGRGTLVSVLLPPAPQP
ncbi:ATP-binding protein [Hymenobacter humi]|uniref:histidine kinase n=1 Tax=Hymenobacter humi TaxID=1411620 RepID=A0ABW2UFR6_9BACT